MRLTVSDPLESSPSPVRVGVIGLSAIDGWARRAHVPAIRAIPGLSIEALTASGAERSRLAAEQYSVPHAFDGATELAKSPDVDLVVVTVRVDRHASAVLAALRAGKAVFCEWPLGISLDEARRIDCEARRTGVRTFVGLQGRSSPLLRYLGDLIAGGYIGRPLSSSLIASTGGWGQTYTDRGAYYLDAESGGSLLSIPAAHTLDSVISVLGNLSELSAWSAVRIPEVTNSGQGRTRTKTAIDQLVVTGRAHDGLILNCHFRGGVSLATNFHWEINGTDGDLLLSSDSPNFWITGASLRGANSTDPTLRPLPLPRSYEADIPSFADRSGDPGYNVAFAYHRVLEDLLNGTHRAPSFQDALALHELLDRIEEATSAGQRR